MSIRYRLFVLAAAIVSLAATPACYTLLKHPRLASLDYARPEDSRCLNCHSSEEVWAFGHPVRKPTYASYARDWMLYYDIAWWYGKSWDYHPDFREAGEDTNQTGPDDS